MATGSAVSSVSGVGSLIGQLTPAMVNYLGDEGMGTLMYAEAFGGIGAISEMLGLSAEQVSMLEGKFKEGEGFAAEQRGLSEDFNTEMRGIADEFKQFTQAQYDNWEGMFGDMRQNLTNYYNELDPTKYATQYKASIQENLDKELKQFDESMAQTGIYTSGMRAQAEKEKGFNQAEQFANADIMAEDKVMAMKEGYYGKYGEPARVAAENAQGQGILGQGTAATSGYNAMNTALGSQIGASQNSALGYNTAAAGYNSIASGLGNISDMYRQTGDNYFKSDAAGEAADSNLWGTAAGVATTALPLMFSDTRLKTNIRKVGTQNGYNVYDWDWMEFAKDMVGDTPTRGVLAQEVMETNPEAVIVDPSGYYKVNYGAL